MRHRPRTALLALGAVTVLGLTGCSAIADADPGTGSLGGAPAAPAPAFDAAPALAKLETLGVEGRAPKTGYTREQFGPSWSDDNGVEGGHNGCDTRNDILRRDLVDLTYKTSTRDCVVATGTLHDPYTGTSYRCTYVSRQIDVKALYRLWVTQAEKDAMSQVLRSC
jgi:hypothetical protein